MSHHGSDENPLSRQFRDQMKENFEDLMKRSEVSRARMQELTGATGRFPHGKVSTDDQGELAMAVGSDPLKGVVFIDFGKDTRWIGFEPSQVDALCELLQKHKRALS